MPCCLLPIQLRTSLISFGARTEKSHRQCNTVAVHPALIVGGSAVLGYQSSNYLFFNLNKRVLKKYNFRRYYESQIKQIKAHTKFPEVSTGKSRRTLIGESQE